VPLLIFGDPIKHQLVFTRFLEESKTPINMVLGDLSTLVLQQTHFFTWSESIAHLPCPSAG